MTGIDKTQAVQWVYAIHCEEIGVVKIGVSSDVQSRLAALQTAFPFELSVFRVYASSNAYALEARLHLFFKGERLRGEWFNAVILRDLDKVAKGVGGFISNPLQYEGTCQKLWLFCDSIRLEYDYLTNGEVPLDGSPRCWEYLAQAIAGVQLAAYYTDEVMEVFLDKILVDRPKNLKLLIERGRKKYPAWQWENLVTYLQEFDGEYVLEGKEYSFSYGQSPRPTGWEFFEDDSVSFKYP